MKDLLRARVILVTGKGGVGKTTVACALALLATREGKRVLVAEVGPDAGAHSPALEALTGHMRESSLEPVRAADGIDVVLLTPGAGHRAFLKDVLPLGFFADRALKAEPVRRFLEAAPAFQELGVLYRGLQLVKKERKRGVPEYDLVIIDAPATGHALAFATLPHILLRVIPGGPIGRAAREGIELFCDPERTRAVVATLPESLPVSEALELCAGLEKNKLRVDSVVMNLMPNDPFSAAERDHLTAFVEKERVLGARWLEKLARARVAEERLRSEGHRAGIIVREHAARGPELVDAVAAELGASA